MMGKLRRSLYVGRRTEYLLRVDMAKYRNNELFSGEMRFPEGVTVVGRMQWNG